MKVNMITHFHGMTESAYLNWKQGEGKQAQISPWDCSDKDNYTYLWSVALVAQAEWDIDLSDMYDMTNRTLQNAFENAVIQAAIAGDSKVYVFALDLSNVDSVESDSSCNGMDQCERMPEHELNKKNIVHIREYSINPYWHPFIIADNLNRELFNQYSINENILAVAVEINRSSGYSVDWFDSAFTMPNDYNEFTAE